MATVGLDINENGKPTAIAVVRMQRRADEAGRQRTFRDVWALERLSAICYDEAVERVAEIVDEATRRAGGYQPTLYGNVTATGRAVLGALKGNGIPAQMKAAYLTAGDRRVEEDDGVKLGKGWLVFRLQELLQTGRLLLPGSVGVEELKQELLDYRHADDSLGPLMIALGLAVQEE